MGITTLAKVRIVLGNWLGRPVSYGEEFFGQAWFENWHRLKDVLADLVVMVPRVRHARSELPVRIQTR